jgi:hypothetical protein
VAPREPTPQQTSAPDAEVLGIVRIRGESGAPAITGPAGAAVALAAVGLIVGAAVFLWSRQSP